MSTTEIASLERKLRKFKRNISGIASEGKHADEGDESFANFEALLNSARADWDAFEEAWDLLDALANNEGVKFPDKAWQGIYDSTRDEIREANCILNRLHYKREASKLGTSRDRSPPVAESKFLTSNANLPRISIPRFSGDLLKWTTFRDTFRSLVHDNFTLSSTQKLHYLLDALSGEPASLLSGLPIQEGTYDQAWRTLIANYDNPRVLASLHLQKILDCDMAKERTEYGRYERFLASVGENVEAFKNLKLQNEANALLSFLALRALDPETRRNFELQHTKAEFPDVSIIIDFVRQRKMALKLATNIIPARSSDKSSVRFQRTRTSVQRGVSFHTCEQRGGYRPDFTDKNKRNKTNSTLLAQPATERAESCALCKGQHSLPRCFKFNEMSAERRVEFTQSWKGCHNCLRLGHKTRDCPSKWSCKYCGQKHHSLLHTEVTPTISKQGQTSVISHSCTTVEKVFASSRASDMPNDVQRILGTAQATIKCSSRVIPVRVLLDSGSEHSFITAHIAKQLGTKFGRFSGSIVGMSGAAVNVKGVINCTFHTNSASCDELSVNALVVDTIASRLPSRRIPKLSDVGLANLTLADPHLGEPGPIDFLAGIDFYPKIITGAPTRLTIGELYRQPTVFGTVILGTLPHESKSISLPVCSTEEERLSEVFKSFCDIEEPSPADRSNPEDQLCESFFTQTLLRSDDGRYVVRLPLKPGHEVPGNNREVALRRFYGLEKRLARDSELREKYLAFMGEYISLGHMSLASKETKYIIPHHGVMQGSKLRVVFDASCGSTELSLNDILYTGPKLHNDLGTVLMNFRLKPVALTADIVKMYRQILVHPSDRHLQHIFWREDPSVRLDEYQLNTVTYGVRCSAYHAIRVLRQLVQDHGHERPEASACILRSTYVDDIVTGADSLEAASALRQQLIELLMEGGFELAKWTTNCPQIIPEESRSAQPLSLTQKLEDHVKILGLMWCPQEDSFIFQARQPKTALTKRVVLSVIARVFDPLGFLAPIIFYAKAFLQELWKLRLEWDEPLPATSADRWKSLIEEWPCIENVRIPRYVSALKANLRLVGFSDASALGYSAAVYIRVECEDGEIKSHLLKAKTKVAPSKFLTIAQLELCGALLLKRVMDTIEIPTQQTPLFFTDSSVVLAWLGTPFHQLKVFEANRVSAILSGSRLEQWCHVKSDDNPADIASRGCLPSQIVTNPLWWAGPIWMLDRSHTTWQTPEVNHGLLCKDSAANLPDVSWMLKFSSLSRIIGVVSLMLRWAHRFRCPNSAPTGPITGPERRKALLVCARQVQRATFSSGLFSSSPPKAYMDLHPFVDEDGIIRVSGRLRQSSLPYEQRHPVLLPRGHHFSQLMTRDTHERHFHAGPTLTVSLLRRNFWIPGLYRAAKGIIKNCVHCRRLRARPITPLMGDLPKERVQGFRAFVEVGIDFAGPFLMKDSLRRKANVSKGYVCVFICLASRAIHIELVSSLTTKSFLDALDRFVARRGLPLCIHSDHGTNFIGASRFLKELYKLLKDQEKVIVDHLAPKSVEWKFIPPRAPHFGGIWEAAVKSVKRLLLRTVGTQSWTFEELCTILARIEGLLNCRPLCPLREDPDDYDILTPGHFLVGAPLHAIPYAPAETKCARSRWEGLQQQIHVVWERWRKEYLHHLQQRVKWNAGGPNLSVGDLVIMIERRVPLGSWPVARVCDVHPGTDGIVRVVSVRTPSGQILKRAVRALAPLFGEETKKEGSSLEHA